MKKGFLIHYSEIGLKGENRPFFEKKLAQNINSVLVDPKPQIGVRPPTSLKLRRASLKRLYGRFFLEIPENSSSELAQEIKSRLKTVFGIANFSEAYLCERDLHALKHVVWETIKDREFSTFRIRASRADKSFPLTSRDIEFQVGGFIKAKSKAEVNLEKAGLTCFIEILSKEALFYFDKVSGPGGLPVTTAGKVVALLSGGIDSPVAAWQIAKRGAKNVFIHFHSYPQTDKASQGNVKDLAKKLAEWQLSSKLYLVPLLPIQKEIVAQCPAKLRVILYRRMMLRLAEKIARKERAQALVTGESLGQVASQTLENINATGRVATIPVLRPLIGTDKGEIVDLAKEIGTYEISIRPYEDCCSLFVPEHPETKSKIREVEKAEEALEIKSLLQDALSEATHETFKFPTL